MNGPLSLLLVSLLSFFAEARVGVEFLSEVNMGCRQQLSVVGLLKSLPPELKSCEDLQGEVSLVGDISANELLEKVHPWVRDCQILSGEKIDIKLPQRVTLKQNHDAEKVELNRLVTTALAAKSTIGEIQIQRLEQGKVNCGDLLTLKNIDLNLDGRGAFSFSIPGRSIWITGSYKVFSMVPVLLRNIAYGQKITETDYEVKRAEITAIKNKFVTPERLLGSVASRTLVPGQILTEELLKQAPLVNRGQIVELRAGGASFQVTMSATAEQAGYLGDYIKVKNINTKTVLSAVVVDRGIVEVQ